MPGIDAPLTTMGEDGNSVRVSSEWETTTEEYESVEVTAEDQSAFIAELFDEEAVNDRARRTVEARMRENTVDATNVRTVQGNNSEKEGTHDDATTTSPRWGVLFGFIGVAILTGMTVAIIVTVKSSRQENKIPGQGGTFVVDPTMAPSTLSEMDRLRSFLSPISSMQNMHDESTAQHRAIQWLAEEDEYDWEKTNETGVVDYNVIVERYATVLLYFATGGPDWGAEFLNHTTSVCDWSKTALLDVDCDDSGSVYKINIGKKISWIQYIYHMMLYSLSIFYLSTTNI